MLLTDHWRLDVAIAVNYDHDSSLYPGWYLTGRTGGRVLVIGRLQVFSSAIRRTFARHFTRFQVTARSRGPSATTGLLGYFMAPHRICVAYRCGLLLLTCGMVRDSVCLTDWTRTDGFGQLFAIS